MIQVHLGGGTPFPRALVLSEIQSALSRIRTRVADSISFDDNRYAMSMYDKKIQQNKPSTKKKKLSIWEKRFNNK